MKKTFNKGVFLSALTILITSTILILGCNKSLNNTEPPLTNEQKKILSSFSKSSMADNELDLTSVKRTNSTNPDLYIISAKIKGDNIRYFILKVDATTESNVSESRYLFESNIKFGTTIQDLAGLNGTGDFNITSLDNEIAPIRISFKNGVRLNSSVPFNSILKTEISTIQKKTDFYDDGATGGNTPGDSKLAKCINDALNALSIGEMFAFIVTMPESYALLLVGCSITVVVKALQ